MDKLALGFISQCVSLSICWSLSSRLNCNNEACENTLFPDGSGLSPGSVHSPHLFRRWLEGIRPAQVPRAETFRACHQSASLWSTTWRMSPFWKGSPASAHGMVGSSWGQYSVMARMYTWQGVHNGTIRRTHALMGPPDTTFFHSSIYRSIFPLHHKKGELASWTESKSYGKSDFRNRIS